MAEMIKAVEVDCPACGERITVPVDAETQSADPDSRELVVKLTARPDTIQQHMTEVHGA